LLCDSGLQRISTRFSTNIGASACRTQLPRGGSQLSYDDWGIRTNRSAPGPASEGAYFRLTLFGFSSPSSATSDTARIFCRYASKAARPLRVKLQIVSGYFPLNVFSMNT